ncbi:MAG TPA: hypothetical protein VMS98_12775 [Thermoanaerobaculia bacterium]|nr:hypothetical protein [Thermoanaerobaculia bacterium]
MSNPSNSPHLSRTDLVEKVRCELLRLARTDTSICRVAADRGVFCRGFLRFTDDELRDRFSWIDRKLGQHTRRKLEEVVDRWQLARQEVNQVPLACDVQQVEGDGCRGWDDFSDEDLSRFYLELKQTRNGSEDI